MGLLTLLFYAYLLIIPIGLVALGLWLMRYTTRLEYPPERRIIFTVIVIACLTFIAFSLGVKLNKWRTPANPVNTATGANTPAPEAVKETPVPQNPAISQAPIPIQQQTQNTLPARNLNEEERLQLFETEHYPGLYEQRVALNAEINDLENFFIQINQLATQTPKQLKLLQDIYRIRRAGYDKLQQRNISVSQHLRDFWVHYNTGNSHDAMTKFTPVAQRLAKQIKATLGQMLDNDRREERVIREHTRQAGAVLKSNKIPNRLAGKITAYSAQNRNMLIIWLRSNGPGRTLEVLERLFEQRIMINDRTRQVKSFQKRYPDIKQTLQRTLDLWAKARESNYFAEYRLLFAVESLYLIDQLNLTTGQTAAKRLNKELNAYTERVGGHAEDALEKAEQAYKPPRLR